MESDSKIIESQHSCNNRFLPSWFSWCRTSYQSLLSAESKLFNYVKNKCNLFFVPLENQTQYLRTLETSKSESNHLYEDKIPIVLVHGLGGGIGFWVKNLDSISDYRRVYALDLLGFGFSSRPKFPNDPVDAENIFVESLEQWRQMMGLDKFILLGHSFGGYLACAYTFKYHQYVRHLILADPWGISRSDPKQMAILKKSVFMRTVYPILKSFNPMALIRFIGPFGPGLVKKLMPDVGKFFQGENLKDSNESVSVNPNDIFDYIYHCNAQYPSGEIAFKTLLLDFGCAYKLMIDRTDELDKSVPISFIYGGKSWMDVSGGLKFYEKRPDSYVDIRMLPEIGHHVYVQDSEEFNKTVNGICETVDSDCDTLFNMKPKERYAQLKSSMED